MPEKVPSHWYNSPYYIPTQAPIPSKADYDPKNVAWLIEFFAGILKVDPSRVMLRYPNNTEYPYTEDIPEDDIVVSHPEDGNYLEKARVTTKSPELMHYERHAKKSAILALYEAHSPAKIKYFQTGLHSGPRS